jgi:hypothetical protein
MTPPGPAGRSHHGPEEHWNRKGTVGIGESLEPRDREDGSGQVAWTAWPAAPGGGHKHKNAPADPRVSGGAAAAQRWFSPSYEAASPPPSEGA